MEQIEALVIGAGQAGLATSHELTGLGVNHVVLERGRIGETWRNRWNSFCLVCDYLVTRNESIGIRAVVRMVREAH